MLPACIDCHQPHKVRKVFYTQGMADADCLKCHEETEPQGRRTGGRCSWTSGSTRAPGTRRSRCSQCHSGVNASRTRACETITQKVDCAACHTEVAQQYAKSQHGKLLAKQDTERPVLQGVPRDPRHRAAGCRAARRPSPRTCPQLCARCHREGEKAARALPGAAAPDHRALHREHPRQGAAEERPDRHRDLHRLPHGPRRAAADRPRLERQPRQRARTPAAAATTASRSSSRRASTTTLLGQDRQGAAGLQRLPQRAHDPARRRRRLQARHHAEVRPLPRGDREDLLRHLPRQGEPARLHQDRQVLRLPRRARHPARRRPALAPLARERGRDLPEVPPGRDAAASRAT